jgi:hypothetical protein
MLYGDDNSGEEPSGTPETSAINVEQLRRRFTQESSSELMSLSLGDSEVSLLVAGYWKSTLTASWGFALTPLGASAISTNSPILFQAETDLTLSLWIRERWFVEASFLDDYDPDTYRAGYQGFEGEPVQYVGIGNTGLDFPRFPYLDLGGDSPSSLGAYGRFGSGPVTIHSLIRYDTANREERTFVGDRERTFSFVSVDNPLRGLSFVLPDEAIETLPVVYIEDSKGTIPDNTGGRWRIAQASEYAVSALYGLLEMGGETAGRIAVSYTKGGGNRPWDISMGTYRTAGFLYEVQTLFGGIDLAAYPQPGQTNPALLDPANPSHAANRPGEVTINGVPALVVYERGTFSPFERQSRYRAPTSNSAAAALVRPSTGERIGGFDVFPIEDISISTNIPLYANPETKRGIFEITGGIVSGNRRDPQERWPLGYLYPEIYLPGKSNFTGDVQLRFTNYGSAGSYFLGSDVVPGSVQVYRGGLIDTNVFFYPESGVVELGMPAGFNEVIRITYLKRTGNNQLGSIAAGIGAVYDPPGALRSELALGLRWNISTDSYTEEGSSSPGTVGLGALTAWEYDYLKARVTAGFSFEQPDTTGLYRVAGMEGSEFIMGLSDATTFISELPADSPGGFFSSLSLDKRAPLVYRNYRNTDFIGNVTVMGPGWSGAEVVADRNGPYAVRDPLLSTEVLAAEFSLGGNYTWTGFQAPLGIDAEIIERAEEIEVPFRFYNFIPNANFRLIVQFGALIDENGGGFENPSLIVEKQLPDTGNPVTGNWQIGSIRLTNEERRKLQGVRYMRILMVDAGAASSGVILIAPPIIRGAGFRPIVVNHTIVSGAPDNGIKSVSAMEQFDPWLISDIVSRVHPGGARQRVLEVSWKALDAGESAGADGRTGTIPLSTYRRLSFFFKAPAGGGSQSTLRFAVARGPDSLALGGETALEAYIPAYAFIPGVWSKVEIRYGGGDSDVYVNGAYVPGGIVHYNPGALKKRGAEEVGMNDFPGDSAGQSGYVAVYLSPNAGALPDGQFSIDEIILEDPSPAYRLNAGSGLEWTRPGALISYGGKAVLSDLSVSTSLESGVKGDPFTPESETFIGALSRSRVQTQFLGTSITTDFAFSAATDYAYWSAGHAVSRFWGPFFLGESFSTAPFDLTMAHRFGLGLDAKVYSFFNGDIWYEDEKLRRQWQATLGARPNPETTSGIVLDFDWYWTENTDRPKEWMPNYAETWAKSWEPLVPDLGAGSQTRDFNGRLTTTLDRMPVGVEFSLDGVSRFSKNLNATLSSTTGRLDFPFAAGLYRGLIRGERNFTRSLFYAGYDFRGDGYKYVESLKDGIDLWVTPPIYSLFYPYLGETLTDTLKDSDTAAITERGRFNDIIALSLQFPSRYGLSAFIIPQSFQYQIDRVLEQKLDTRLDVLNTSATLGFSAMNMFGAFGVLPLFNFYESDEFTHSLGGAVAFPRNEDPSWRVQATQSMIFHGFLGAQLSLVNTITLGTTGWLESLGLDWTAPVKKSLLGTLYGWAADKIRDKSTWPALSSLAETEYERLRKETLELVVDNTGEYFRYSVILGHESIIRILGRLYLSVFAKIDCTRDNSNDTLSFLGTIGTTLNISF